MSKWMQLGLQDSASSIMAHVSNIHDWIMVVVVFIVSLVFYIMYMICLEYSFNLNYTSNEVLEFLWISIPSLVLMVLAIPSLHCLYLMEELSSPSVTFKAIGHQWYWSYEYSDSLDIEFDSYMKSDLAVKDYRLLEVDNKVMVPFESETRVLTSSSDVLHSWSVPSLGAKVDAIPGRVNQLSIFPKKLGVFYGQCSEMCGAMHSFMPIVVESNFPEEFSKWLLESA